LIDHGVQHHGVTTGWRALSPHLFPFNGLLENIDVKGLLSKKLLQALVLLLKRFSSLSCFLSIP